jgi:hypothetical protein
MQADEVRYKEDMPALGLNLIHPGLDVVLYDPKTKPIYTCDTKADYYTKKQGLYRSMQFFQKLHLRNDRRMKNE